MINKIKKFASKNRFCERLVYIAYRACTLAYSLLFLFFRIFPIQENKIVASNMKGKRYGDNPKYIFDEIICQDLNYELVWLMKGKNYEDVPDQIKCVAYNPFSIAYHLSTAKIWIDSNMKSVGTLKRRGQYFIQTWHGSPSLKKLGFDEDINANIFNTKPFSYNAKIEDVMLSNCKNTTEMFRRGFHYNGKILDCGCPRNDIFFKDPELYKEKISEFFHLKNKYIILFAPTYREDFNTECLLMDFDKVIRSFEQRFGGEWVLLVRLHPNNIQDAKQFLQYSHEIINATNYNVMQELLVAADVLITDYSSSMFDFSITKKPCFLYATDVEKYEHDRDFYFDINKLPFPLAQNDEELLQNINSFDESLYRTNLEQFFENIEFCENGTACKQVVNYIRGLK